MLPLLDSLQVLAVKQLDKIFKSLTIPPMAAGQFSQTDRRILGFLALILVAGLVFNLYRQNKRTSSPGFLLSALELPSSNVGAAPKENLKEAFSPVDLNRAGAEELERLPGIGPALAQRILDYRRGRGDFRSVTELLRVPGIGPKKLAEISPRIYVSPAPQGPVTERSKKEQPPSAGVSLNTSLRASQEKTP